MSNLIPKERLTAYQRWEMASFDEASVPAPQEAPAALAEVNAELARLREEARAQGYKEGMVAGMEQGRNEGMHKGLEEGRRQARQEALALAALTEEFADAATQANEQVAGELLDLALDLAKAMLKTALHAKPELVLPIVTDAIRYLPSLQQPAVLTLHPDDAVIVREHMAEELDKSGWRVTEDPQMERGGCRVETATNQIDASTPLRWQRIAEALGKESDWLA